MIVSSRRPSRALAALVLAGPTFLAPGCGALAYGFQGLEPFVAVRADVTSLAVGTCEKPWFLPLFGPLLLADLAPSLVVDLVVLPAVVLRELRRTAGAPSSE